MIDISVLVAALGTFFAAGAAVQALRETIRRGDHN